jgi:rhodanese-related sulfurtransferase
MAALVKFVWDNILLITVALTSGAMLLWPLVRRTTGGPWVTAAQATHLINREDALVVDVREPAAYGAGHILGAKNVPLARLDAGGEIAKRKDKPLIVYDERGDSSPRAVAALKKQGFSRVLNLNGGLGAWRQAGLPVER